MGKRVRVIPVLLIYKNGLTKTIKFKQHKYVGDPINAVKIFNEKEVDEIVVLDISATNENRGPDIKLISDIASEAFMPLAYGGGIRTLEEIKALINCGVEKIVLNTSAVVNPVLLKDASEWIGSQSLVVSIDVKKNIFGKYKVYSHNGRRNTGIDPVVFAIKMAKSGVGEIYLNSIDLDGTFGGYDLELIKAVSSAVSIPVVALGGARGIDDFSNAIQSGASAVAAGSLFIFQMPHRAVLISYPSEDELKQKLFHNL